MIFRHRGKVHPAVAAGLVAGYPPPIPKGSSKGRSVQLVYLVAYCDPQCERLAVEGLADQGYWPYLPTERYYSRRLRSLADRPLFPRYLFVGIDIAGRQEQGLAVYRPIRGTRGVKEVLMADGNRPGFVNPLLIAALRDAERVGVFDRTGTRLKVGDRVRTEGAFKELIGTILKADDIRRIQILYHMLGREVVVKAPLALIERV